MFPNMALWIKLVLAAAVAFLISFLMTPPVKRFAESIGAVDEPGERRINKVPIPRMGGLAIFLGFTLAALLFGDLSNQTTGILLGAVIIAVLGGGRYCVPGSLGQAPGAAGGRPGGHPLRRGVRHHLQPQLPV